MLQQLASSGMALSRFERVAKQETVADGSVNAIGYDRLGRARVVIALASPDGPMLVENAVRNAATARELVGSPFAEAILEPIAAGTIEGLSYAVWPYCTPLRVSGIAGHVRKPGVIREVIEWLAGASEASRKAAGMSGRDATIAYGAALEAVYGSELYSGSIRDAAAAALRRLRAGEWRPSHVLDHNDFWQGNLRGRAAEGCEKNRYRFTVIDWPGANGRGYGMYDAIRLARSMGMRSGGVAGLIRRMSSAMGCEPMDTSGHLMASIGHLGQNLGCFRPELHARCAEHCWRICQSGLAHLAETGERGEVAMGSLQTAGGV
ncbi:MAG: hypothetical protein H7Y88_04970 [Phycisphaerales bacterium]|nr:hypothetical protein [Phycisphaerales bacterium]